MSLNKHSCAAAALVKLQWRAKKITVWKLAAQNEDAALIEFDVCAQTNAVLCAAHTMQTQPLQVHTHTITTYLKGLPRDLTNFFNFSFARFGCCHDSIPLLIPFGCHSLMAKLLVILSFGFRIGFCSCKQFLLHFSLFQSKTATQHFCIAVNCMRTFSTLSIPVTLFLPLSLSNASACVLCVRSSRQIVQIPSLYLNCVAFFYAAANVG